MKHFKITKDSTLRNIEKFYKFDMLVYKNKNEKIINILSKELDETDETRVEFVKLIKKDIKELGYYRMGKRIKQIKKH